MVIMKDYCVCCGRLVPEGRMICFICEHNDNPVPRKININIKEQEDSNKKEEDTDGKV
jgi:hypothetical protein